MHAFTYHMPTKIVFGAGTQARTGSLIKAAGGTRVLVIYAESAARSGLLSQVQDSLKDAQLVFMEITGVKPNPLLGFARECIQRSLAFRTDFVLAIGGGSVIDTAKAVAHGTANPETDLWDLWTGKTPLLQSLPIGVVLTLAASGSETSVSAVLTDETTLQKRGMDTPFNRPLFAVMNPELTRTVPRYLAACGAVDILMHTMDRYFTSTRNNDMTDELAEAVMRIAYRNSLGATTDPPNPQSLSELMWCGSLSHCGLTGLGAAPDFTVHALGRELSAMFNAVHGATLSTMWSSWARYTYHADTARFTRFAHNVLDVRADDDETASKRAIEAMEQFFLKLKMPICFSQLGIGVQPDTILEKLAYDCCNQGTRTIGAFRVLDQADIMTIYRMANH